MYQLCNGVKEESVCEDGGTSVEGLRSVGEDDFLSSDVLVD